MIVKNTVSNTDYYQNWKFIHPNGFLMFYSDEKKAKWYLSRNLAELVDEKTVKFKFMPKSYTKVKYNLSKLQSICVVCGSSENLSRHHVVPYMFRKHMPESVKAHSHHDVLLLCRKDHDVYEVFSNQLKEKLYQQYSLNVVEKTEQDFNDKDIIKQLTTIKQIEQNVNLLDKEKPISIIKNKIAKCFNLDVSELDLDLIYKKCSKNIVDQKDLPKLLINNINDLQDFIKMWRMHFVDTMKPKYLPKFWNVDYVV